MIIPRIIKHDIEEKIYKGKIIILYGARQVGKTTLVRKIQKDSDRKSLYLNCDEPDIRSALTDRTSTELKSFIGNSELVIIDEAQRVRNIGLTLKLIADNYPEIQIIATGSSSFELANTIVEPLTGRKFEFILHPLSLEELKALYAPLEINRLLERWMVYGTYPGVVTGSDNALDTISEISKSYLFKDILSFQQIRHPDSLEKLLQGLALQAGNEVSYNELGELSGLDKNTVESYIQILEKAFIIFRLNPFSRNLRNELKKLRKIYFHDTGIRNSIIKNFNGLDLRQDTGQIWENFIISERSRYNSNHGVRCNRFFWRNHNQQEIDYLEEKDGLLKGYEIKWKKAGARVPRVFLEAYKGSTVSVVNNENYMEFVM